MDIAVIEQALQAANITDPVKRMTLKMWLGPLSLPPKGALHATTDSWKQELSRMGLHPFTAAAFVAALTGGPATPPARAYNPMAQSPGPQSEEALRLERRLHTGLPMFPAR